MKKIPLFLTLILVVGVLATMAFTVPVQMQTGIVVGYTQGKSMTVREFGHNLVNYNLTSSTKIIGASGGTATGVNAGDSVTVMSYHMKTALTDGWIVLAVIDRSPASASSSGTTPQATPQAAPQASPTP